MCEFCIGRCLNQYARSPTGKTDSNLTHTHRLAVEDWKTYWQRVSKTTRDLIGKSVRDWTADWLKRTISWDDHLARDAMEQRKFWLSSDGQRHEQTQLDVCVEEFKTSFSWAARLSRFQCASFFNARRVFETLYGRTHTRTRTRVTSGFIHPRWHDCEFL